MRSLLVLMLLTHAVAAKPVWRGGADLDGDGTPEAIEVTLTPHGKADPNYADPRKPIACTGASCTASINAGTAHLDVEVTGGWFGGLNVEVIALDPRTKARELLITQRVDDDEDPAYVFTVITFDGTSLHAFPLWTSGGYNTGTVGTDGKGHLVVSYDDCPAKTVVTYARRGGTIVEVGRAVQRKRPEHECAG